MISNEPVIYIYIYIYTDWLGGADVFSELMVFMD
jgi:hypothetical protein